MSENWIDESGIYHVVIFIYDENGSPIGMSYSNSTYAEDVADNYLFVKNMQGDIVHIYDDEGNKIVSYQYDAWGTVTSYSGSNTTAYKINPFRYRGYYYDVELRLYYLNSRYYDPEMGRFISADGVMSGADGSLQGANLFAYCFNNPVNLDDSYGNWPKWVSGALNVVSGALQMVAAAALGAATGWTGVGALAAGALAINGAATMTQGIGQIVNDISDSNTMREDNIVRSGVQDFGEVIGGDIGGDIAGALYDAVVMSASLYSAGTLAPKNTFHRTKSNPGVPFKPGVTGFQYGVDPNTLVPTKNLSTLDPQRMANAVKYGGDQVIHVGVTGRILDGHHRVANAISNGRMVDVFVEIFK